MRTVRWVRARRLRDFVDVRYNFSCNRCVKKRTSARCKRHVTIGQRDGRKKARVVGPVVSLIGDASKTASRNAVFRCNRVALPSRVIHAAPFRNDPRVSGPFRGRSRHLWWQRNSREIINNPCNDAPPPLSSLSLSKFQPCAAATWNIHDYDSERSCVQRNTGAKF